VQGLTNIDAGVVDKNVGIAESPVYLVAQAADARFVGHIGEESLGVAAVSGDASLYSLERGGIASY
jgi:hypothetical protein